MRKRTSEKRIFFPWEKRGGWLRRIGLHRARPFLLFSAALALLILIGVRDRRAAGIRLTRAMILETRRAVDLYLADHQGHCPESFDDLRNYGPFKGVPRDAWGYPLRLICPDPTGRYRYRLMSGGPDGIMGGLDRIE